MCEDGSVRTLSRWGLRALTAVDERMRIRFVESIHKVLLRKHGIHTYVAALKHPVALAVVVHL